jgi:archaea-specific DNA-binding protein
LEESKMAKESKEQSNNGNFVFVGKKGVMAYVLAVITQMGEGAKEVIIKARGKSISRAVDVAEIVRNKSPEIKLVSIDISTEEVETEDGKPLKISAIAIKLKK